MHLVDIQIPRRGPVELKRGSFESRSNIRRLSFFLTSQPSDIANKTYLPTCLSNIGVWRRT